MKPKTFEEYKQAIIEVWTEYKFPIPSDEELKKHWEEEQSCRKEYEVCPH